MTIRKMLLLLVLFVGTSVIFITLDNRGVLDPVTDRLHRLIEPVTDGLRRVGNGRQTSTEEQIAQLEAERDMYRAEAARLQAAEEENVQLRNQLGIESEYADYAVLSAGVLNTDPTSMQKFITIDKGSDDGVQVGMAVVDPYNFVGQVTAVEPGSARVTLFIDVSSVVGAQILGGGDGMLYGQWQVGGRAELRYVDIEADPRPGAKVVTTSDGATQSMGVPGGLFIGTVGDGLVTDEQRGELTVPIIPACDFDNLKVVTVILGPKDPNSSAPPDAPEATGADPGATDNAVVPEATNPGDPQESAPAAGDTSDNPEAGDSSEPSTTEGG